MANQQLYPFEKPSDDEIVRRILHFYAGQNIDATRNFKQSIDAFDLTKFFESDHAIELMKQRMMEEKLLKAKNGRLFITNHGFDIVTKHGGYDKYLLAQTKLKRRALLKTVFTVYTPIILSIGAFIMSFFPLYDVNSNVNRIDDRLNRQQQTIDSIKNLQQLNQKRDSI